MQDTFVLDNIFALIDEYICADLSTRSSLFPLHSGGGPYIHLRALAAEFLGAFMDRWYATLSAGCSGVYPELVIELNEWAFGSPISMKIGSSLNAYDRTGGYGENRAYPG